MAPPETWLDVRDRTITQIVEAHRAARARGGHHESHRLAHLLSIARSEPATRTLPQGLELHWSTNAKLQRTGNAVSFCLPAFESIDGFKVCRGAGVGCRWWCYACNSRYETPRVQMPREFNLAIVRRDLARFIKIAVADLERLAHRLVRIHDSGDFLSQDYLDAWKAIARIFPDRKIFYVFTKSLDLDIWQDLPPNMIVIQSELGMFDDQGRIDWSRATARMFESHESRIAAGYIDGTQDDWPALLGERRLGHVYHGPKGARRLAKLRMMLRSAGDRFGGAV